MNEIDRFSIYDVNRDFMGIHVQTNRRLIQFITNNIYDGFLHRVKIFVQ